MILWCDGAHDPAENMRRDRALLERAEAVTPPEAVLRLFQFQPHGITLGHAQRPERVLDLARCEAEGIPWAVRPTGGRAIFHAEEWTYSLSASIEDPEWGGGLAEAYERASRLLVASLQSLGIAAILAGARAARGGGDASGAACFASTARHEILLQGRKLVGSAQRRTRGALLQQGSVLLGTGHLRLADYLAIPEVRRRELRAALAAGASPAGNRLGDDAALSRWAAALMEAAPRGTRRIDAALGCFLLTLPESPPYTPSVSHGVG